MKGVPYPMWLFSVVVLAAGCSGDYEVGTDYQDANGPSGREAGAPAGDAPAPSRDSPAAAGASEVTPTERAEDRRPPAYASSAKPGSAPPQPSTPSTRPAQPPGQAPSSPQALIRLTPNAALAQTLPTGTAMGFSVDYVFMRGEPHPSVPYFWVVEPAKGQTARQEVRLAVRGRLEGFFLQLRPEHGPFKTHIEDYRGNRVAQSVSVR